MSGNIIGQTSKDKLALIKVFHKVSWRVGKYSDLAVNTYYLMSMVVIWYCSCLLLSQTCSWTFGNYLDDIYLCNHHFHGWGTPFFRFLRKRCPDLS